MIGRHHFEEFVVSSPDLTTNTSKTRRPLVDARLHAPQLSRFTIVKRSYKFEYLIAQL